MVVIAIGREETPPWKTTLRQLHPECLPIEGIAAVEIRYPQVQVSPMGSSGDPGFIGRRAPRRGAGGDERFHIERLGHHGEFSVVKRPALAGSVGIKFQPVAVGIRKINRFAYPVVGETVELNPARAGEAQPCAQGRPSRKEQGGMK